MDDFDFVLGLSFLDRVDALIVPCADVVCILEPTQQCVVPLHRDKGKESKKLTSIQLAEDAPIKEDIALETTVGDKPLVGQELPKPKDMEPAKEPPMGKVEGASNFIGKEDLMRFRVKPKEVHLDPDYDVFEFDLLSLNVFKDQEDPRRGKSQPVRVGSYDRDVRNDGAQDDVAWRYGPKQADHVGGQPI